MRQKHNAETCVAHAGACFRQADIALPLLTRHMAFVHKDRGGYRQLQTEADAGNPKGPLRILSVTMAAKSELSCDECAQRFPTLGDLWVQMSINPVANARTAEPDCRKHTG